MDWLEVEERSWIVPVGPRISIASEAVSITVVEAVEAETEGQALQQSYSCGRFYSCSKVNRLFEDPGFVVDQLLRDRGLVVHANLVINSQERIFLVESCNVPANGSTSSEAGDHGGRGYWLCYDN